jgi:hypothetical protein
MTTGEIVALAVVLVIIGAVILLVRGNFQITSS